MTADARIEQAELLYERAVFGGDSGALASADLGLDAVEADLALARGRVVHARFLQERVEDVRELELFERAAELYGRLGDVRGEGEALFWVGTFHQVVRDDTGIAVPAFERALDLATRAGDRLTTSYALRHLGFAHHMAGRLDEARAHFEESTRLRRELGFLPGVAANLIGLAHLAAQQDRRDDAAALLDEATELAGSTESHGVLRWVAGAREELGLPRDAR
ncbi:tetratricopeptide repeat protein [Streptomyces sp. 303MFCol5.2]|uniref:tetratricopeptide repeat protein n=1 Tax=Streptomyces sp. 303MFCol5.2 TaxID=1172181 RepID=UPI00037D57CB|nr:tetratricopeptide repeat protein [Streptomyces sp. 303MFCol5.2]